MTGKAASIIIFLFFFPIPGNAYTLLNIDSTLTCNGSLGDNIFTDGDFGSGSRNILGTNPQIAPGYSYTISGPPRDGYYTITNNTGSWNGLYGTWLKLRDNSSDPNGYFMVVNASFDPGLFYEKQVDGLCGNTQYEFSLDIINLIQRSVGGHIKPNVDMLLDDQVVLSTGQIDQNEKWNHYSISFCTGPNQNSMKLSIRNNAPGGTGNDLGLDNISFRPCGPEAIVSPAEISYICVDDTDQFLLTANINDPAFQSVRWQLSTDMGQNWQDIPGADQLNYAVDEFSSGTYLYRYMLATSPANLDNINCRLISEVKTMVVVPVLYEITDTICDGNTFPVGNSVYTASGTYVDSLISSIGCDSIVTTNLTVLPKLMTEPVYTVQSPNCFMGHDGSINISSVPDGIPPFLYVLDGVAVNTNGRFSNLQAGTYQLEVLDKFDCSFPAEIVVPPPLSQLTIQIPPDTTLEFGETLKLSSISSIPEVTYSWTPSLGLSCIDCPDPVATPASTTTYYLEVTDPKDCTASDTINIAIERSNFLVHAPTAFTPNGDGHNDIFHIVAKSPGGIEQIRKFSIFNRWGENVYTTNTRQSGQNIVSWDGTRGAGYVSEGLYVYVLELGLIDGRVIQHSGSVTVLR